jgi:hypothetical protein
MNASKTVIDFLEPILSQKPLAKKMYFKCILSIKTNLIW